MCVSPQLAWQDMIKVTSNGKHPILFSLSPQQQASIVSGSKRYKEIFIPCGKCLLCKKDRSFEIVVRSVFEYRLTYKATFITLTVSPDRVDEVFPKGSLDHRPWQLFAKRLRKTIGPFRFLMCGEYGSKSLRPHYHAVIFGHDLIKPEVFDDGTFCNAPLVMRCWPFGHIQADEVNVNRLAYIAGYTLKDQVAGRDDEWYDSHGLLRPYVKWSRNPGLGYTWFESNFRQVFRQTGRVFDPGVDSVREVRSQVVLNGGQSNFSSRYLKEKLPLLSSELYDKVCVAAERGPSSLSEEQHKILMRNMKLRLDSLKQKLRFSSRDEF